MSMRNVQEEVEDVRSWMRFNSAIAPERKMQNSYEWIKRMIDILLAFFALVFFTPLFLIIVILIKLEDPKGSVLFKQKRVGKDEKTFYMFKFRSMVTNAEQLKDTLLNQNEVSGAMFKMKNDPRITKIGRILRKTSMDELPQLWNVLIGEMSLVGPRPPLTDEVKEYTPYDKQRLVVTPGCTGLWQVSGRSNLSFKEMVELDLKYIRNRSVWFDLKIIAKTGLILLSTKDAY